MAQEAWRSGMGLVVAVGLVAGCGTATAAQVDAGSASGQEGREPGAMAVGADRRPGDAIAQGSTCRHVRAMGEGGCAAAVLLSEAERRAPTIRAMVAALEQRDVIVYVQLAMAVPSQTGRLTVVPTAGAMRIVKIEIDVRNCPDDRIVWLGHELAHALEVSMAPEVRDDVSLAKLYARIGRCTDGRGAAYETEAAKQAGRRVKAELAPR
jgi:hypothetical protein